MNYPHYPTATAYEAACRALEHHRERLQRLVVASDAVGGWLSAALDDPKVCSEMKDDIRRWFDVLQGERNRLG